MNTSRKSRPVKDFEKLELRIKRLVASKRWDQAAAAGRRYWEAVMDLTITDPQRRLSCAVTLLAISDVASMVQQPPDVYGATLLLRRAYQLAAHEIREEFSTPSRQEYASYRLGLLFQEAKCHYSAVYWFRRALALSRTGEAPIRLLINLYGVGWNLELLKQVSEAGAIYAEMLPLLWPCAEEPLLRERAGYLSTLAMYHLYHGDSNLGEVIMHRLVPLLAGQSSLPSTGFPTAVVSFGNYYLDQGRGRDAVALAVTVLPLLSNLETQTAENLADMMHGLIARAAIQASDFTAALREFGQVLELDFDAREGVGPGTQIETVELWRDVARIRVHLGDLPGAASVYEYLAQFYGTCAADWRICKTSRERLSFIRLQAEVVHELASVWLSTSDTPTRDSIQTPVANALLQLKANHFLATQGNRLTIFRDWGGIDRELFRLNGTFAAAARRVEADPEDVAAALALDDALFARERWEGGLLANANEMIPALAEVFHYDSRNLGIIKYDVATLLDYSLIEFCPPVLGLRGMPQGFRYLGLRMSKDRLHVQEIGTQSDIDHLVATYLSQLSVSRQTIGVTECSDTDKMMSDPKLINLAEQLFRILVEPFGLLGKAVLFSPDGRLAALPFHALIRDGRFLIEDIDVGYSRSLLQEEALARRQRSPGMRISIDVAGARDIVLIGDPEYGEGGAQRLQGTKLEIAEIASLFGRAGYSESEVHIFAGKEASAASVSKTRDPRILHVAAHGGYFPSGTASMLSSAKREAYKSWRRREDMGAEVLSELDYALLRAVLVLAPNDTKNDPGDSLLTALELSSLNLIACDVVALSACETGIGEHDNGAGVLGFQYAILTSFAHAGLISLWKVPDRETAVLMATFYGRSLTKDTRVRTAYSITLREACRQQGRLVHPFYWAAFVLLGGRA